MGKCGRMKSYRKVKLFLLCAVLIGANCMSCESINPTRDETAPYRISLWNEVPQLSRESGPPGFVRLPEGPRVGASPGAPLLGQGAATGQAERAHTKNSVTERPLADYSRALLARVEQTYRDSGRNGGTGGSGDSGEQPLVYRIGWVPFREAPRRSADLQLFVQVIKRKEEKLRGMVFLFHGYANDSSYMTGVAGALLQRNWAVVLVDLPGHGLSTGKRGDVERFHDYGDTVQVILDQVRIIFAEEVLVPYMAFGHSTGALALVDYSIRYENQFSRMVFYAPLVRSVWWNTSRMGLWLLEPFVKQTRAFAKSPLWLRIFPIHWFDELVRWEAWARKQKPIPMPPLRIIQPVQDSVVQSTYNARFIQERAPETELLRIDSLSHFATDASIPDSRLLDAIVSYFE